MSDLSFQLSDVFRIAINAGCPIHHSFFVMSGIFARRREPFLLHSAIALSLKQVSPLGYFSFETTNPWGVRRKNRSTSRFGKLQLTPQHMAAVNSTAIRSNSLAYNARQ